MSEIYRPTWLEINLSAIKKNLDYVMSINPNKVVIPVIKADAYGHGAIPIMHYLYDFGYTMFAVSLLEEAIELREENKKIKILMLGPILEEQLDIASKYGIDITIYSLDIGQSLLKTNLKVNVHLKIDTGMNRYGLKDKEEIINLVEEIQSHKTIVLEGIYTHFATANDDVGIYRQQVKRFSEILDSIKVKPNMIHVSNSSSAIKYESQYDYTTHIRLGISMYGLTLDRSKSGLTPALTLKSRIVQIKKLKAGESVGYGATYTAVTRERIAIIPIGYADGWIKKNRSNDVEIYNKRYKTIGLICMDAMFISVDDSVNVGDEVTLFGHLISIDEVARKQGTHVYEVCTNISKRVPKTYIKGENS